MNSPYPLHGGFGPPGHVGAYGGVRRGAGTVGVHEPGADVTTRGPVELPAERLPVLDGAG